MRELEASSDKILQIGYEGEDNVTTIKFLYDKEWLSHGNGEFKVRVLRNGDTEAYNATQIVDDRENMNLTMTVTDIEFSKKGRGELQLVYICADSIKKSPIYRYNVNRAIDSEVVDPPEGSIIAEVEKSLAEIKDEIGSLADLTTEDKTSLVSAINEVNAKEVEVTVDSEMSDTSENPVQNKAIKEYVDNAVSYVTIDVDSELSATSENPVQNKIVTLSFLNALDRLEQDESQISDNAQNISGLQNDVMDVQTALAGKASTDVATQLANGLMSATDKTKLDGLGDGISDVQINGTSVVTNGVAEIPFMSGSNYGVARLDNDYGVGIGVVHQLTIQKARDVTIKAGTGTGSLYMPIVPFTQHQAVFYGLAKAAGDTTQSASSNAVGTYTEEAKSAISDMLNGAVQVSGTTPTITALSGVRYVCGEVATLDITPCASGICDIVFTSGSTATVLTLPSTVKFPDGAFTPEADTTYEINILDGVYGAVMAWT